MLEPNYKPICAIVLGNVNREINGTELLNKTSTSY